MRAILAKGLACAQLYPEEDLRPSGDIDVYVRPEDAESARSALEKARYPGPVDLHEGIADLDDRSIEELFERARVESVDGADVLMLSPEDHLRLLCLHMLRHGAVRPIWVCDIAAAVESRAKGFDWDYFLGGDRRRMRLAVHAIGMAQRLLKARLADTPIDDAGELLPSWVLPTVLNGWGRMPYRREPLVSFVRNPSGLWSELFHHWPNAIEATVGVRGSFNELPRTPFQVAHTLKRAFRFAAKLPPVLLGLVARP